MASTGSVEFLRRVANRDPAVRHGPERRPPGPRGARKGDSEMAKFVVWYRAGSVTVGDALDM